MNRRVWVLGDAVIDLVPDSDGRYLKCPGGAPARASAAHHEYAILDLHRFSPRKIVDGEGRRCGAAP